MGRHFMALLSPGFLARIFGIKVILAGRSLHQLACACYFYPFQECFFCFSAVCHARFYLVTFLITVVHPKGDLLTPSWAENSSVMNFRKLASFSFPMLARAFSLPRS